MGRRGRRPDLSGSEVATPVLEFLPTDLAAGVPLTADIERAASPACRRRFSSHQMPAATAPPTTSQPMAISSIIPLMPDPIMVGHARVQRQCHPDRFDRTWLTLEPP